MPVKKVIIALDEGVSIEHIMSQCDKLKGGIFNNNKEIYCIYDNKNIAAIISKYRDKDNMFATNYKSIMHLYYIGHPELTRYGLEVGDLSLVPETMRDMFIF